MHYYLMKKLILFQMMPQSLLPARLLVLVFQLLPLLPLELDALLLFCVLLLHVRPVGLLREQQLTEPLLALLPLFVIRNGYGLLQPLLVQRLIEQPTLLSLIFADPNLQKSFLVLQLRHFAVQWSVLFSLAFQQPLLCLSLALELIYG